VICLDLSPDQQVLRDASVRFIESQCPLARVRALIDHPMGVDADYIRNSGELGWFAGFVPEQHGGGTVSGSAVMDATVVAELRGRFLQPGPFVPMNVVASAIATAGSDEQRRALLPGLAAGEIVASWALGDVTGDREPGAGLVARPRRRGFALSGVKGVVQDAHLADWILVGATAPDGPLQLLVPATSAGVSVIPLEGLDLTRRMCEVRFKDVEVPPSGVLASRDGASDSIERSLDVALTLAVAESVGAMDRLFEMTVAYAKDRTAFARPIGSFQAVKHLLADMSLVLEASKAAALAAARALRDNRADAGEVASMAKAFVGESGIDLSQGCLQVHGGIGYTWEHDLHLYLRRLATDNALYGDPVWHRERICRIHDL
jgi:alkylation response protein AidB-like acyl-CoA dehydrogenase